MNDLQPEKKNEGGNTNAAAGSKLDNNLKNKNPRRMPNILEDEEHEDSVEMHR